MKKATKWESKDYGNSLELEELKALIKEVETNNWDNFYLRADSYGYDGANLEANYSRLETDEEFTNRTAKEKVETKKKQVALMKKRQLYEKLKAQFES